MCLRAVNVSLHASKIEFVAVAFPVRAMNTFQVAAMRYLYPASVRVGLPVIKRFRNGPEK